ncbi:MAG: cytidylate kinase-like family protein [Cytophagales bacterium]|nr:cytidylate kinase-like family protein [Cytophagales bacterium]
MENNELNEYLKYVLFKETHIKTKTDKPFITINAQSGCQVDELVAILLRKLNKEKLNGWKVLDKDILKSAAEELKIKENVIKESLVEEGHNFLNDFIESFSKGFYGPSTQKLTDTIQKVVRRQAERGNTILVGRAADMITADMKHGLHVFLEGPIEWRIKNLQKQKNLTKARAIKELERMQEHKKRFRDQFEKYVTQELSFSISINQALISPEEAAKIIMRSLP